MAVINVVTSYAFIGQLLSSVVKVLILQTYSPVVNPYATESADNVPGLLITTAVEHGTSIVPLNVVECPSDELITYLYLYSGFVPPTILAA